MPPDDPGLHVIGISAATDHVWNAFPFLLKVWYLIQLRDSQARRSFISVLFHLVTKYWAEDMQESTACDELNRLLVESTVLKEEREMRLPSKGPHPPRNLWRNNVNYRPSDDISMASFRWMRDPPIYKGDVRTYVERPLQERPELESVHLLLLRGRADGRRYAVLGTSSTALLQRISSFHSNMDGKSAYLYTGSLNAQVMWLLCIIYLCMADDIATFVYTAATYIEKMVRKALYYRRIDADVQTEYERPKFAIELEDQILAPLARISLHCRQTGQAVHCHSRTRDPPSFLARRRRL